MPSLNGTDNLTEETWVGPKRLGWIYCGRELHEKRRLL